MTTRYEIQQKARAALKDDTAFCFYHRSAPEGKRYGIATCCSFLTFIEAYGKSYADALKNLATAKPTLALTIAKPTLTVTINQDK